MSYARFGPGSDLYLIKTLDNWICVCCRLVEKVPTAIPGLDMHGDTELATLEKAKSHVGEHIIFGHTVPDYCIQRIEQELND